MKNRLLAMLMAAAMVAAMAPAALAEEIQADVVEEAAAVEEIAAEAEPEATPAEAEAPAEEAAVEEAPAEEAAPVETVAEDVEAVDESTVEAAEVKEPETIITGEDIALDTMYAPEGITLGYTEIKINVGESLDIKAIVTPYTYENSNAELRWTTSDKNYFTVEAKQGNICTIKGVKVTAREWLTVESVQNPNVTARCQVVVTSAGSNNRPITEVKLDKKSASMSINDKLTLTATYSPTNTTSSTALYWGCDNKDVATIEGGANNTGIITAKDYGTAHVYVETSNGKYDYCTINVSRIKLNTNDVKLGLNSVLQLNATVEGNKAVQWSSDNTNIATVDANGLVTAVGTGNATITARTDDGMTATCSVAVSSFKLNETHVTMGRGATHQLYATVDGTNKAVTWSTDKTNVATVNGDGLVYAIGNGSAIITAKTADGMVATCTVTVGSIKLNDTHVSLTSGGKQQLYASVEGNSTVTWSSDKPTIATVDANGLITAVDAGNAVITAKTADGLSATCTVYVTADEEKVTTFVVRLYDVCLDRQPDPVGLVDWTRKLMDGTKTGSEVAYGFIFSNEFKAKNYCNECFTKQLYRAFMGREYDQDGLDTWIAKLNTGSTREAVFNGFALSPEFRGICDAAGIRLGDGTTDPGYGKGTMPTGPCSSCGNDGVTPFVTRMYQVCMLREPDEAGLKDWVSQLYSHKKSGRDVAYGFIFSKEFLANNYNDEDYVERLYESFMGRSSDATGKADWVGKLKSGAMNREKVFDGFVGSREFMDICGKYGIVRG